MLALESNFGGLVLGCIKKPITATKRFILQNFSRSARFTDFWFQWIRGIEIREWSCRMPPISFWFLSIFSNISCCQLPVLAVVFPKRLIFVGSRFVFPKLPFFATSRGSSRRLPVSSADRFRMHKFFSMVKLNVTKMKRATYICNICNIIHINCPVDPLYLQSLLQNRKLMFFQVYVLGKPSLWTDLALQAIMSATEISWNHFALKIVIALKFGRS